MLIDKEAALKKMCKMCYYNTGQDFVCRKCNVYELLAELPAVEAEPVRHGRWIEDRTDVICSSCGCRYNGELFCMSQEDDAFSHCPNCGAKMDATDTNDDKGENIL